MQITFDELSRLAGIQTNGEGETSGFVGSRSISFGPTSRGEVVLLNEESCTQEQLQSLLSRRSHAPSAVLVPKKKLEWVRGALPNAVAVWPVHNTTEALYALASEARAQNPAAVLAVTGSVGKTTTVSVFGQVLSRQKQVYVDERNRNLLAMTAACMLECANTDDIAIYEVAAMPNGMVRASQLLRPNVVVFTGTGLTHLEYMHAQLIVADVKSQLFFSLGASGTAVINHDDRYFHRIQEAAVEFGVGHIVTYGEHPAASVRLLDYEVHAQGTRVSARVFGTPVNFEINQQGKHWALVALSLIAAAPALKVDPLSVLPAFAQLRPASRRGERHETVVNGKKMVLINDAFNANPTSMTNAVTTLCEMPLPAGGRRVLVLGDMLALGESAGAHHRELAEVINTSTVDTVICCGEWMAALHQNLLPHKQGGHFDCREAMEATLPNMLQHNDMVLVKGSRGMTMEKTVQGLLRK